MDSKFKKGQAPWNKGMIGYGAGRKHSEETKKKISKSNKKEFPKSNKASLMRRSTQYRIWRDAIFERDNYICRSCNSGKYLQAHHIIPFSEDEDKICDVNNGITLCIECHGKIHGIDYTKLIPQKKCEWCGNNFKVPGQRKQRFCSKSCKCKWQSTLTHPGKGKIFPERWHYVTCLNCGLEFRKPQGKDRGKYCSMKCYWEKRKKFTGKEPEKL